MPIKLTNILSESHFIGIELFTSNGEDGISLLCIKRKRNELNITYKEKRESFNQLNHKPNKENTVVLVINNSSIIQKEIENTDNLDAKILNKVFPNLKTEEFFYEIWRIGTKAIVAICRKNYVNELLEFYKKEGVNISGISIGVCSLSQITSFNETSIFETNSTIISLESNDQILKPKISITTKNFDINGLEIQSSYLLGFASLLRLITKNNKNTGNIIPLNNQLLEEFHQKSFFRKSIKWTVYTLLFLLLINFFVFNHYYEAVTKSNSDLESNKVIIENIKFTKERLKTKEEKLKSASVLNNSKSSWQINELLKEMPSSILLNELIYNPLEKNIKEEEKIVTKDNTVIISGKTINNIAFTNWLDKIEKDKSVTNVTITSFGKNENKETVFSITITILPNET